MKLDNYTEIGELVAEEMGKVFGFRMEGDGWKNRVNVARETV